VSLTAGWPTCELPGRRADRVSLPHRHPGLRLVHRGDRVPAHPLRLVLRSRSGRGAST
jgi:hypothetical protein